MRVFNASFSLCFAENQILSWESESLFCVLDRSETLLIANYINFRYSLVKFPGEKDLH